MVPGLPQNDAARERCAHRHDNSSGRPGGQHRSALGNPTGAVRPVHGEGRIDGLTAKRADQPCQPAQPAARARPTNHREPEHPERARLHRAIERETHHHERGATTTPGEERPLRPVKEGEHPPPIAHGLEARVDVHVDPKRREPQARDKPEHQPKQGANALRHKQTEWRADEVSASP